MTTRVTISINHCSSQDPVAARNANLWNRLKQCQLIKTASRTKMRQLSLTRINIYKIPTTLAYSSRWTRFSSINAIYNKTVLLSWWLDKKLTTQTSQEPWPKNNRTDKSPYFQQKKHLVSIFVLYSITRLHVVYVLFSTRYHLDSSILT